MAAHRPISTIRTMPVRSKTSGGIIGTNSEIYEISSALFDDHQFWRSSQLSAQLGLPLKVCALRPGTFGASPISEGLHAVQNDHATRLFMTPKANSTMCGGPTVVLYDTVLIAREDGYNLDAEFLDAMDSFIRLQVAVLHELYDKPDWNDHAARLEFEAIFTCQCMARFWDAERDRYTKGGFEIYARMGNPFTNPPMMGGERVRRIAGVAPKRRCNNCGLESFWLIRNGTDWFHGSTCAEEAGQRIRVPVWV